MANNTGPENLEVTELDFETIKENIKNYLRNQDEFLDYDFEGSALNILVDVLSYNTHYMGFYANMLANESFLDSAIKRESVVSHAKQIGYTPRSITAARATVDITITTTSPVSDVVIPKGTQFVTEIDGETYTFVTTQVHLATSIGGNQYKAADVEILEGKYTTFSYIVDTSNPDQRFLINNAAGDTSTLIVAVQNSVSDTTTEYFDLIEDINLVDGESQVYFLQEVEEGLFEVYFGDGILGKPVVDGNIVIIENIVTNGTAANKASAFIPVGNIGGFSTIDVTTVSGAEGGADAESIESIRCNAPKFYQAQNRVVTAEDYRTALIKNTSILASVDSVVAWGGEDNVPPQYGLTFISVKPKLGSTISTPLKTLIEEDVLKQFNVVTITPVVIDPEFLFIEIDTKFTYTPRQTTLSDAAIEDLVRTAINDYNENTLEFFGVPFRHSNFVCMIDDLDRAITNNLTTIRIKKKFTPRFNINTQYTIRFENPIEPESMASSGFVVNEPTQEESDVYYFRDDGEGNIVLYKILSDLTTKVIDAEYGTIDYEEGIVDITCFAPISLVDSTQLSISFEPTNDDVFGIRNLILTIEDGDVVIDGTPDLSGE